MIKLITGIPRSGKTLLAITRLVNEIARNKKANDLGEGARGFEELREFRTNIDGVVGRIEGVLPLEKDWRQYPDGSYLVYDESHKKGMFRTTGKSGLSDDDVITELDEHGHRGFDITFITQFPSKIHMEIRQLVGLHTHVHRAMSMERATIFEWNRCIADPYDLKDQETGDESLWEFPKENYKLFDSASVHTHKFVMPSKIKNMLYTLPIIVAVLGGFVYWMIPDTSALEKPDSELSSGAKASGEGPLGHPPPDPIPVKAGMEWTVAAVLPELKGCAKLSKSCRCWNGEGKQLDLNLAQCLNLIENPLPISFNSSSGNYQGEPAIPANRSRGGALDLNVGTSTSGIAFPPREPESNNSGTHANASNGWLKN